MLNNQKLIIHNLQPPEKNKRRFVVGGRSSVARRAGFSIAEVVVAVFVISTGLLAIISLIINSLNYSMLSRDQVIASQLAQEGIELVRNVRDNNIFNGDEGWNDGLSEYNNACVSYDMDTQTPNFTCLDGVGNQLYYDQDAYTYSHSVAGNEATRFYRQLALVEETETYGSENIDKLKVTASVWWGGSNKPDSCNSASKCVSIENILMPYE